MSFISPTNILFLVSWDEIEVCNSVNGWGLQLYWLHYHRTWSYVLYLCFKEYFIILAPNKKQNPQEFNWPWYQYNEYRWLQWEKQSKTQTKEEFHAYHGIIKLCFNIQRFKDLVELKSDEKGMNLVEFICRLKVVAFSVIQNYSPEI